MLFHSPNRLTRIDVHGRLLENVSSYSDRETLTLSSPATVTFYFSSIAKLRFVNFSLLMNEYERHDNVVVGFCLNNSESVIDIGAHTTANTNKAITNTTNHLEVINITTTLNEVKNEFVFAVLTMFH